MVIRVALDIRSRSRYGFRPDPANDSGSEPMGPQEKKPINWRLWITAILIALVVVVCLQNSQQVSSRSPLRQLRRTADRHPRRVHADRDADRLPRSRLPAAPARRKARRRPGDREEELGARSGSTRSARALPPAARGRLRRPKRGGPRRGPRPESPVPPARGGIDPAGYATRARTMKASTGAMRTSCEVR